MSYNDRTMCCGKEPRDEVINHVACLNILLYFYKVYFFQSQCIEKKISIINSIIILLYIRFSIF